MRKREDSLSQKLNWKVTNPKLTVLVKCSSTHICNTAKWRTVLRYEIYRGIQNFVIIQRCQSYTWQQTFHIPPTASDLQLILQDFNSTTLPPLLPGIRASLCLVPGHSTGQNTKLKQDYVTWRTQTILQRYSNCTLEHTEWQYLEIQIAQVIPTYFGMYKSVTATSCFSHDYQNCFLQPLEQVKCNLCEVLLLALLSVCFFCI